MSLLNRIGNRIQELKFMLMDTDVITRELDSTYSWTSKNIHKSTLMLGVLKQRGVLEHKGRKFFSNAALYSSVDTMEALVRLNLDQLPKGPEPYRYPLRQAVSSFNGPVILWLLSQGYSREFLTGGHAIFPVLSAQNEMLRSRHLLQGYADDSFYFNLAIESKEVLEKIINFLCNSGFSLWDIGCGDFCCRPVLIECAKNFDFELMEILLNLDDQLFFQRDEGLGETVLDAVINAIILKGKDRDTLENFKKVIYKFNFSLDILDERLDPDFVTKAWRLAQNAIELVSMEKKMSRLNQKEESYQMNSWAPDKLIWMAEVLINLGADRNFRAYGVSVGELIDQFDRDRNPEISNYDFSRQKDIDDPYAIFRSKDSTIEWRVLRANKKPSSERRDIYAAWYVGAKSIQAAGAFDLGDCYISEIRRFGRLVAATEEWQQAYRTKGVPTVNDFLKNEK